MIENVIIFIFANIQYSLKKQAWLWWRLFFVFPFSKSSEEKKFPKLSLQTFPEKAYVTAIHNLLVKKPSWHLSVKSTYVSLSRSGPPKSGVVLPALKQSLGSTIADRQRRTRAVQRDRFKRTVQWQDQNYSSKIHLRTGAFHSWNLVYSFPCPVTWYLFKDGCTLKVGTDICSWRTEKAKIKI